MKITLRELRSLIREAAKSTGETKAAGLALYVPIDEPSMTQVVLYKPATIAESLSVLAESARPDEFALLISPYVRDSIIGAIRGEALDEVKEDVTFITRVAAKKGYGPLLYDFMSTKRAWITPDSVKTSPSAASIWNFYKTSRHDVLVKPTEDIHEDPNMNFKVKVPSSLRVEMRNLEAAHDSFLDSFSTKLHDKVFISDPEIKKIVERKLDAVSNEMLEASV